MLYASLAHYGVYGTYQPIILSADNIERSNTKVSIQYDGGNIFLSLISSENLKQPVLSLYDLLGRKIKTMPVTVGINRIEINSFPKGMYLYRVETEEKIFGQGKLMN